MIIIYYLYHEFVFPKGKDYLNKKKKWKNCWKGEILCSYQKGCLKCDSVSKAKFTEWTAYKSWRVSIFPKPLNAMAWPEHMEKCAFVHLTF